MSKQELNARIEQLEDEVRERDEAIATLTAYLEGTAQQLENLKRNSGCKGSLFDDDSVADQLQLVGEMHRVVDEWDTAQTVLRIEQLSAEIDGLRTLIAPEAVGESALSSFAMPYSSGPTSNNAADGSTAMSSWEAMKAGMLSDSPPSANPTHPVTSAIVPGEMSPIEPHQSEPVGNQELDLLAHRPTDIEGEASVEQWREAAEARESHLIAVIRNIRAMWARRRGNVGWQELTDAPAELRNQVEQREADLHQKLRAGEVDLSMERARLGREEMMMRQAEEEIQKRRKRRGKRSAPQDAGKNDNQDRRWLRFLTGRKE